MTGSLQSGSDYGSLPDQHITGIKGVEIIPFVAKAKKLDKNSNQGMSKTSKRQKKPHALPYSDLFDSKDDMDGGDQSV